jgi:hypothetical protein
MKDALDRGRIWRRAVLVLGAAVGLCWPAVWNGYPLLFPDSMNYLSDGLPVWRAVLGRPEHGFVAMRSEMYSDGIFLVHWGWSPWPVVALQAVVTAWMVWLVVRAFVGVRAEWVYAVVMAVTIVGTSAGWFVSMPMPDILGAVMYLGVALLVFAGEGLARWEWWAVAGVCWWGIVAHSTHLMVVGMLCGVLGVLWMVRWVGMRWRGRALLQVMAVVGVAVGAQLVLHAAMYGSATLNGERPVYLMARVIDDGPAVVYLKGHCGGLQWTICRFVDRLPENDDEFLWGETGVWASATVAEKDAMRKEEMPLVMATVRAYPREQMARSWGNFVRQMGDFGMDDYDNNEWMAATVGHVMPGGGEAYARSRQARSAMPQEFFTRVQNWVVGLGVVVVLGLLPWTWRERKLMGLVVVVGFVLVANAVVTGVLSGSDARYQSRVVWMVVVVAGVAVARAWERRASPSLPA